MKVIFHHTHAYDEERVQFDDVMQPALNGETGVQLTDPDSGEPLFEQVNPQDVLGVNVHGDMTRRTTVVSEHTTVQVAPGAVELICQERIAANSRYPKTFRPVLAELLVTGAAAERFDLAHLYDITIEPDDQPGLRDYLLEYFGVTPQAEPTPEPTPEPAPEPTPEPAPEEPTP